MLMPSAFLFHNEKTKTPGHLVANRISVGFGQKISKLNISKKGPKPNTKKDRNKRFETNISELTGTHYMEIQQVSSL